MRILILSAYNAVSHNCLNNGIVKYLSNIEFTVLSLPPRFFPWRAMGNSLSFAFNYREELTKGYDLIFATSLTDITSLKGLVPELAKTPVVVYFHENQFDYPDSRSKHVNTEVMIISIINAFAADKVIFNTKFNMQSFMAGAKKFLKKMPDFSPHKDLSGIEKKASVLSVPIEPVAYKNKSGAKPVLLWNHRWEYDKGPDRFLNMLRELKKRDIDFDLNIVGQVFRDIPESFQIIEKEFEPSILNWGFAESRDRYEDILSESSFIISTSVHDFQGLSVMEAADAGCTPILPNRVAYPEIFSNEFLYDTSDDLMVEASNCADLIVKLADKRGTSDMSQYYWGNLKEKYEELFLSFND